MLYRPGSIIRRWFSSPMLWVALQLVGLVLFMPWLRPVFAWAFPETEPPIYGRVSFLELLISHAALVGVASLVSTVIGVGLGVFVTRPAGRDFYAMVNTLASVGQTFPPAAVLAIAVPMVGFGSLPRWCSTACCRSLKIPLLASTAYPLPCAKRLKEWGSRPCSCCSRSSCHWPRRSSSPASELRLSSASARRRSARRSVR